MTEREIVKAVVDVLNAIPRPPALAPLAYIKYPHRELKARLLPSGSYELALPLYGFEYKHKGPRPKNPPPIDTEEIRLILTALLPNGMQVTSVEDRKTHLFLSIRIY